MIKFIIISNHSLFILLVKHVIYMNAKAEALLLNLIKERREIIISKIRNKSFDEHKDKAWIEIKVALYASTGKHNDLEYIKHRWANIQERVKNKLAKKRKTGESGGVEQIFSENDNLVLDILGRTNPKIEKIPNPIESSASASIDLTPSEPEQKYDDTFDMPSTSASSTGISNLSVAAILKKKSVKSRLSLSLEFKPTLSRLPATHTKRVRCDSPPLDDLLSVEREKLALKR